MRSTWILLAIALLLGGYVWWVEIRGKQHSEEAEEAGRRLVALEIEALDAIEVTTPEDGEARIERPGGGDWRLVTPVEYAVDDFTVDRLVEALGDLKSTHTLDAPDDVAQFGLGDEAHRLRAHAGGETLEIALGKRAPVGASRYVQVSSRPGKIFAVAYAETSPLEPDLVDLRDKRIAKLEADAVRALVVRITDGPEIRLERDAQGEGWRMTAPHEERADAERIERVLDDLVLARASDFADAPSSPAEHGLDPPTALLELVPQEGEPLRLALGRTEDAAWVRRGEEPALLEVRERLVDGLPREVFEYRHKRVLTLDESGLGSLELNFPRDGVRYRFERGDSQWKPDDPALRVDSLEISDLVFALEELDATAIEAPGTPLANLGLDPPRVRVTARDPEGAELGWLELGDPDPERGLAARSSSGDTLWRVRNELGEDVPLSLDAFRNDFAESVEPDTGGEVPGPGEPEAAAP